MDKGTEGKRFVLFFSVYIKLSAFKRKAFLDEKINKGEKMSNEEMPLILSLFTRFCLVGSADKV